VADRSTTHGPHPYWLPTTAHGMTSPSPPGIDQLVDESTTSRRRTALPGWCRAATSGVAAPDPGGEYDDGIQLKIRMGDIIVFHGATWHASGANRTERGRMILFGFFCRAFAKPQQDGFRLAQPEVIERATPTQAAAGVRFAVRLADVSSATASRCSDRRRRAPRRCGRRRGHKRRPGGTTRPRRAG